MAIITPALGAARESLNRRFPDRDKASDGWIGDAAHRGTRSGHNPDETGNPEYQDSDSLDEVRAVDLDDDLRHPGLTMHDVVRAILATPADRGRCSYLIYDRTIWSRSADYEPRDYTGTNPHTSHLHISGRPTNDADDRPWLSIERLGIEEDDVSAEEVWDHDSTNVRGEPKTMGTMQRWTNEYSKRTAERSTELLAGQAALHAAVTGQDPTQAFRTELARHRAELVAELGEDLAAAVAAELGELPAGRVEQAVADALARTRLTVAPADEGGQVPA